MSHTVLIATVAGDLHAHAVALCLRRRGVIPKLWYTSDFPARSREACELSSTNGSTLTVSGTDFHLRDPQPDVVWNRRVGFEVPFERLAKPDRYFAELEAKVFRDGVMTLLAKDAFWVNPWQPVQVARYKQYQLQAAGNVSLRIPPTLCTNDPAAIRTFIRNHGGEIIYKPLRGVPWSDGQSAWGCYTTLVREDDLPVDELLSALPGIYQARIEKAFELRVTVIGEQTFAAKIDSQSTRKGQVDWRLAYDEITMTPFDMPQEWVDQCRTLLDNLGLVFGCLDFIVTPDKELVFLEINEQGQFLFVERYCGLPLLEAFTSLLETGSPRYEMRRTKRLAFEDVAEQAQAAADQSLVEHRPLRDRSAKERPAGAS